VEGFCGADAPQISKTDYPSVQSEDQRYTTGAANARRATINEAKHACN
jgi:hypothetical protein